MAKKEVLFVLQHLNGGGAEKVLIDILKNFDYEKYNVDLMLIFKQGVYLKSVPENVNILSVINELKCINKVPGKVQNLFSLYIKRFGMKKIYRRNIKKEYDYEIAFLEGISTKFVASSYNKKSKKIAWVHTDLQNNHWTNIYYKNLSEEIETYKEFDDIICVSKDAESKLKEAFGKFDNIRIINNPFDIENIKKKACEPVEKNKKFTICSVGRLVPQKGFDRLIDAAKKLADEGYDIDYEILGTGGDEPKLRNLIESYNLQNNIKLLGFVENPYKYIKNCDLYVSSSRTEGLPLVVSEALILNKAIAATRCTGPVEILNDGEYGYITENSEEGLYNAIKLLYDDEEKRKCYEEKSKERIKFFNLEDKMNKIYELLQ